ncbi:MAG: family 10 glycosylhydrolase [Bacteroidota bacterium]|nr:family 10 glycosylhydrolase [Bacteroidota bacterium]
MIYKFEQSYKLPLLLLLFLFSFIITTAQEEPKRELRSTWIATVGNIDWPKYTDRNNAAAQQADLISMLELYKASNLNAVFLQVRTECDALYQSAYEPWSRYLTWAQGTDPGYDPLQFAIEETHKRGIELHVWLNPYRINASTNDGGSYYHSTHIYKEHPEWAIEYTSGDDAGKKILNPGRPEVMSYIGSIVRDIVSNYSIDGVHFDDYFYAYGGTPTALDAVEYAAYGSGMTLGDWRRDNVNRMIDTVFSVIQEINPDVRFGVSPFGIYKNGVPQGIIGFNAYTIIYCDPLAWLKAGTVDYLTPQIYWPTGGAQDFETLVNWWADSCYHYDRHLYAGQATYKLPDVPGLKKAIQADSLLHESKYYFDFPPSQPEELDNLSNLEAAAIKGTGDPVAPWTLGQIGVQIDIIRSNKDKNGLGSVYFSAKDFTRVRGLAEYLTQNKYTHPVIIPEMTWKTGAIPVAPQNLRTEIIDNKYCLVWDFAMSLNDRFAVYASEDDLSPGEIISDAKNLQAISFEPSMLLSDLVISANSYIVVTTVSAIGKEGVPSLRFVLDNSIPFVDLVLPENGDTIAFSDSLFWESDFTDPLYQLQIAANSTFSTIVYTSGWMTDTIFSIENSSLNGETWYFWRVSAKDGAEGPYSGARSFYTGYPAVPELISPANLSQNVSTKPKIKWNATVDTDSIRVLISESNSFIPLVAEEVFIASGGEGILSTELNKDTWYYLKIRGENDYGAGKFTGSHVFKTTAGEIPEVSILSPEDNTTVASFDILDWETTTTTGTITFYMEVALDINFSSIMYNTSWISQDEMVISETNLEGGRTYYWRVKAKSEFGESEFTDSRTFISGYPTRPSITQPAHLSQGNNTWTVVAWIADAETDTVYIEVSKTSDYAIIAHNEKFEEDPGSGQLSSSLDPETWYFIHLRAENEYGGGVFSSNKYFKTGLASGVHGGNKLDTESVVIFPNVLNSGEFIVRLKLENSSDIRIHIYDVTGKNVFNMEDRYAKAGQVDIRINSDLLIEPGLYYVKVAVGDRFIVKPLVIL